MGTNTNIAPYRGVAIHNVWRGLTQDEVLARLQEVEVVELGPTAEVELAGFRGVQTETSVAGNSILWDQRGTGRFDEWVLESNQVVRFIILDTPAGTMLITIGADAEEWDEFLPVADEILAGISFPDLD